jgi:hypothetical protein
VTTVLDKPLKRELTIDGQPYTVTLSPETLTLALKGRRKGVQLAWRALVNGEAALAVALNASLGQLAGRDAAAGAATGRRRTVPATPARATAANKPASATAAPRDRATTRAVSARTKQPRRR